MSRIGLFQGPYQTGFELTENTRTGSVSRYTAEGSEQEIRNLRNIVRAGGASEIDFRPSGAGGYILTYQYSTGENGQELIPRPSQYELDVEVSEVSIYLGIKLKTFLTDDQIAIVQQVVEDFNGRQFNRATAVTEAHNAIKAGFDPSSLGTPALLLAEQYGYALFDTIALRGNDSVKQYHSVFRRTLTTATPNDVRASFFGAGKIWTTPEMQAYENINPTGFFQLDPKSIWEKSPPQVVSVANQKVQVVYHYTESLFASGFNYDAVGQAVLDPVSMLWHAP